jgi:hypothetical protein
MLSLYEDLSDTFQAYKRVVVNGFECVLIFYRYPFETVEVPGCSE